MRLLERVLLLAIGIVIIFAFSWYMHKQSMVDEGSIRVVMCPECKATFDEYLQGGGDVSCAIYDVGSETAALLAAADAKVITDDESNSAFGTPYEHPGLMHNKFCVFNESTVLTGSYNPTNKGELNKNNLVIIESKVLAKNYLQEFRALERERQRPSIPHRISINGTTVENYFCPTDSCEEHVLEALETAQFEITYMTYSFTSDPIGELLLKKRSQGVAVQGMCEQQQVDEHSECEKLSSILWDEPVLLHHKVFVIDRTTVITGSYNPTAGGTRRNRENILIIHSPEIAAQFLAEYNATVRLI
jgi:phosphatidylserine/phosphatidylglycerophosphate/cardiolipin synthase-like enzyme